jgi:hypothetical protein
MPRPQRRQHLLLSLGTKESNIMRETKMNGDCGTFGNDVRLAQGVNKNGGGHTLALGNNMEKTNKRARVQ